MSCHHSPPNFKLSVLFIYSSIKHITGDPLHVAQNGTRRISLKVKVSDNTAPVHQFILQ